ncbi:MAG TPA: FAD-dependent monooxygenase, partial [Candidatus Saccharimonadia bacterium]|nr:FAD-dependent monooxygenase [Candidatus Saccharimonadia bacterium]
MDRYDIAIVGGGLVGSSLACALAPLGWRVAQVEAQMPQPGQPAWDERNLALSRRSVQALDSIGVWGHIAAEAHPIRRVHVTSRGDFGAVRIRAADYALESLGHTVPARALGAALEARLAALQNLDRLAPARVARVECRRGLSPDGAALEATEASRLRPLLQLHLELSGGQRTIEARLVVAADGTDSFVREALGIGAERRDYAQTAIVSTVVPERPHDGTAYERFTDTGPVALLPLAQDRAGLVWTVASDDAARVLALDDAAFLAEAGARAAAPLGRLRRVGRRQAWPLRQLVAQSLVAPRAVVVGNAAQTLHPIGAQGFNLGLRDVLALADALADRAIDPGDDDVLRDYARGRREDRTVTAQASDALVRWFAPDRELLRL